MNETQTYFIEGLVAAGPYATPPAAATLTA